MAIFISRPALNEWPSFRDGNGLKSLGVLRDTCRTVLHFEDTKVSEFQAVAVRKFLHHAVEEKLHDVSNIRTTHSGQISNSIDQLLLRGGAHGDSILGPGGRDRHPRDSAHTNHAVAISVNAKRLVNAGNSCRGELAGMWRT